MLYWLCFVLLVGLAFCSGWWFLGVILYVHVYLALFCDCWLLYISGNLCVFADLGNIFYVELAGLFGCYLVECPFSSWGVGVTGGHIWSFVCVMFSGVVLTFLVAGNGICIVLFFSYLLMVFLSVSKGALLFFASLGGSDSSMILYLPVVMDNFRVILCCLKCCSNSWHSFVFGHWFCDLDFHCFVENVCFTGNFGERWMERERTGNFSSFIIFWVLVILHHSMFLGYLYSFFSSGLELVGFFWLFIFCSSVSSGFSV